MGAWEESRLARWKFELYGKPHIGQVRYSGTRPIREPYAPCEICGRYATNGHHLAQKGIAGGAKFVDIGKYRAQSALIAVCGSGNMSGCHKLFHDHIIEARWYWYSKEFEKAWDEGEMFESLGIGLYDEKLYEFGFYEIEIKGRKREIHG